MLDCKKLLQEVTLAGIMTIFDCKKIHWLGSEKCLTARSCIGWDHGNICLQEDTLAGTMEMLDYKKLHWLGPWKYLTARSYFGWNHGN